MNFAKRSLISIIRRPGKTAILLLLIFVLGNIIAFSISIGQAVNNTEKNLRMQMGAFATIEQDYKKMEEYSNSHNGEWPETENLSVDTVKQIGELPYVKSYDYSVQTSLQSKSLKRYTDPENEGMVIYGPGGDYEYFTIKGVRDPEILDLKENRIQLLSGRVFNQQEVDNLTYVAVISQKLAQTNNLNIGSKFTLENIVFKQPSEDEYSEDFYSSEENIEAKQSYEFEVIGIFEPVINEKQQNNQERNYNKEELENSIYTGNLVSEAAQRFQAETYIKQDPEIYKDLNEEDFIYYTNLYVLDDPLKIDAFKEQALSIIPEYYMISDTSQTFKTVAAPMKSIQWIANIVLLVSVGASLIILSLLITLFLRDRKHEIGIYLALGERKLRVISQIVLEVVVIAAVAIVLSLFSGNLSSAEISKTMLQNQIIAQQEKDAEGGMSYGPSSSLDWMGYGSDLTMEDIQTSYKVSLDIQTVLLFFAVGLGTVIVSTLIPIVYITRLNPKKILM